MKTSGDRAVVARKPEIGDEGTLAVLLGSTVSILVSGLAADCRRMRQLRAHAIENRES